MKPLTDEEKALAETYLPLIRPIARRLAPDWPDAEGEGFFGLVEGLRSYDSERGVPLRAWVRLNIRWRILKSLHREASRNLASTDAIADFDLLDYRGADQDLIALGEELQALPAPLREFAQAYLATGSGEEATRELGLKKIVGQYRFAEVRKRLGKMAA